LQKFDGFEFMEGLINDMTNDDPKSRPTIEEVVERFNRIRDSEELSDNMLRSTITPKNDPTTQRAKQITLTFKHIIRGKSAIPDA
jgi:hypothetical protein